MVGLLYGISELVKNLAIAQEQGTNFYVNAGINFNWFWYKKPISQNLTPNIGSHQKIRTVIVIMFIDYQITNLGL